MLKHLKIEVGRTLKAGIINGKKGTAVVRKIGSEEIILDYQWSEEKSFTAALSVCVAVPRPLVSRRLLKDLSTLGVRRIRFFLSDLSEKSYFSSRIWSNPRKYLLEGAEQAGQTKIPELSLHSSSEELLKNIPSGCDKIILSPGGEPFSRSALCSRRISAESSLAVGPERGWTERELRLFREAGFFSFSLGKRILRTETACLIGSSFLIHSPGSR